MIWSAPARRIASKFSRTTRASSSQPFAAAALTAEYSPDRSKPAESQWFFVYTITIANEGTETVKLLTRHWIITDANGRTEEVRGDGVVGEQPRLEPGEQFVYTSGATLPTAVGTMEGSYDMVGDDGTRFDAPIPPFTLAVPRTLH